MISSEITDYILKSVDEMDGIEFERFSARILQHNGFQQISFTPTTGDQGVDILAEKEGIKYAIQCKCYSSDLGNSPIQEVSTGKIVYRCHVAAVLTNRFFTQGAVEAAEATGTLLWDRDYLRALIEESKLPAVPLQESEATSPEPTKAEDELLPAAVEIVLETGQASVSTLQRRLKLGYARAARIVDEMEDRGIVGPFEGAKPRTVLISRAQWEQMQNGTYMPGNSQPKDVTICPRCNQICKDGYNFCTHCGARLL
nr:MAG TPA: Ftsk gamma domain [Caudoviricetes sp.]